MKIGILTYHRAINLGSIVQAYCLQKKLGAMFPGARVEIIDYRPGPRDHRETFGYLSRRAPFFNRPKWREVRSIRGFAKSVLNLSRDHLTSLDLPRARDWLERQDYDAIVVGSDTVWEYRPNSYSPAEPNVFHLPWEMRARKIGFAVSADPVPAQGVRDPEHRAALARWIGAFDLVFPRDEATRGFIEGLGVSTASMRRIPDPTLQVDFSELVRPGRLRPEPERTVAGISLPGPIEGRIAAALQKAGFAVCNWRGRRSASQTSSLPEDISAAEILGCYRQVSAFVTDRFHGSIFAMKIGGILPIFIESKDKWPTPNSKGRDLYRMLGIEHRVLRDDDPDFETRLRDCLAESGSDANTHRPDLHADALIADLLKEAACSAEA